MPAADSKTLFVVLGNQLFPFAGVKEYRGAQFFMAEDMGLCTYVRHHQQKTLLFLAAMRAYADELRGHGCDVHYDALDDQAGPELQTKYETKLERFIDGKEFKKLAMFEIEDMFFEKRMVNFAEAHRFEIEFLRSPMFLTSRAGFADYLDATSGGGKPYMAGFYAWQRKRLDLLIDDDEKPVGGKMELRRREPQEATQENGRAADRVGVADRARDGCA